MIYKKKTKKDFNITENKEEKEHGACCEDNQVSQNISAQVRRRKGKKLGHNRK